MASVSDRFVTIFTTGDLVKFNMAVDALEQAGIPHQKQEETATGLRLAMPVAPTPGPGNFWSVLVPSAIIGDARRVLSELPFEVATNPEVWDFNKGPQVKQAFKLYAWIILIGIALV